MAKRVAQKNKQFKPKWGVRAWPSTRPPKTPIVQITLTYLKVCVDLQFHGAPVTGIEFLKILICICGTKIFPLAFDRVFFLWKRKRQAGICRTCSLRPVPLPT